VTVVLHVAKGPQKTATLLPISNSGYPLCCWQAIAKSRQLVEQRLGIFQIARVEAFGEPAIDRSEKIAGLIPLALIAPEPRHARRRAQFQGLCLLLARSRERTLEIRFRFRRFRLRRLERDEPDRVTEYLLLRPAPLH